METLAGRKTENCRGGPSKKSSPHSSPVVGDKVRCTPTPKEHERAVKGVMWQKDAGRQALWHTKKTQTKQGREKSWGIEPAKSESPAGAGP